MGRQVVVTGIGAVGNGSHMIPPMLILGRPYEACDLDYVTDQRRGMRLRYVLSNSIRFGGINTSLVFGAP